MLQPARKTLPALYLCLWLPAQALAGVALSGIDGALRDNVLALLELDAEPCDAPAWRIRQRYAEAGDEIRAALLVFGYFRPAIDAQLDFAGDCWHAQFAIDPGEPVRWRRLQLRITGEGRRQAEFAQLLAEAPMAAGAVLYQPDYEAYKRRLSDTAARFGYFDAKFEQSRIDVYPDERAADLQVVFDTGRRYRFGDIEMQQDVIDAALLRRYLRFHTGDDYDARRIAELYEDLLVAGYFGRVDIITTPRGAPDYEVTVSLRLTPGKLRSFSAGLGFGTDTGFKFRGGVIHRRINRGGHQAEFNFDVSRVIAETGLSYRLPWGDPRDEWLNFDLGYKHEETDTSTSDQTKFGLRRLVRRGRWLETQSLDLGYEEFEIGQDRGSTVLPIPGIAWNQTRSAGGPRPDKGFRVLARLRGSGRFLGADADFLQLDLNGKLIRRLWPGARLLLRADLGFTLKDQLSQLPASVRYFAGGDTSVRGYDYKALGPVDDDGQVTGGSHLLAGSVELDQKIFGNWSFAAFVDAGNAFETFDRLDVKRSVGGGLRWYSPLGPIRVDLAFPLDSDAADDFRLHVTLGPDL